MIGKAADECGITSSTFREFKQFDPQYAEAVQDLLEPMLDIIESALITAAKNGDMKAIHFYLKHKGQSRGYSDSNNKQVEEKKPMKQINFQFNSISGEKESVKELYSPNSFTVKGDDNILTLEAEVTDYKDDVTETFNNTTDKKKKKKKEDK
jgi:hypothetical protein